jgi:SAM-dependent methyltransferase
MFATVVPGLTALVTAELEQLPGVRVTEAGTDGQSEVIRLDVDRGARPGLHAVRTLEGLYAETGHVTRASGDPTAAIGAGLWLPDSVQKALSAWTSDVRPLSAAMTYQVAVRVANERSALRTDLRRGLIQAVARDKPRWRPADPAQLEIRAAEYAPNRIVAGLRLADAARERPGPSAASQPGALPPTMAALMVSLAGDPRDVLLDPCCGPGAILGQALAAGWPAVQGSDLDPGVVAAARRNVPGAGVLEGDARSIDLPDETVDAVVSRLPSGPDYEVDGSTKTWMAPVLGEITRVTAAGGRVVLLAPVIPVSIMPRPLRITRREPIRLLGTKTELWVCDRN